MQQFQREIKSYHMLCHQQTSRSLRYVKSANHRRINAVGCRLRVVKMFQAGGCQVREGERRAVAGSGYCVSALQEDRSLSNVD